LKTQLNEMQRERDSLYAAIKMMQDDLMKSESERSRLQQKLLIIEAKPGSNLSIGDSSK